jgi:hypothetical protein
LGLGLTPHPLAGTIIGEPKLEQTDWMTRFLLPWLKTTSTCWGPESSVVACQPSFGTALSKAIWTVPSALSPAQVTVALPPASVNVCVCGGGGFGFGGGGGDGPPTCVPPVGGGAGLPTDVPVDGEVVGTVVEVVD